MKTRMSLLSAGLSFFLCSHAGAVVVANYPFDAGSSASTDTHAQSVAGAFSISGGSTTGQTGISSSTNQPFIRSPSLTTTKDGAITGGDYFSFTWTPDPGFTTPLGRLGFSFGGSNLASGSAADDYTAFMSLRVQIGSGAFFDVGPEFSRLVPFQNGNSQPQLTDNLFIDLSGVSALQNVTDPVTFRFYLYSSVTNNDGKIVRMDNVTLDTVPEPSVAILGLLGSMSLLRRRRDR